MGLSNSRWVMHNIYKTFSHWRTCFSPGECWSASNTISCSRSNVNNMNGRNKRQPIQLLSSVSKRGDYNGAVNSEVFTTPAQNSVPKSNGIAVPQTDDPYHPGHCITIINGMQGVDRRLHSAAVDLFQNENWRKTFISLKSEKWLSWLKAMLPSVTWWRG